MEATGSGKEAVNVIVYNLDTFRRQKTGWSDFSIPMEFGTACHSIPQL